MFFGEQQIKRCINLKPHVFLPDLFIAFTDNVCQPLRTIARVQLMYQCQLPLFLISTEMIFYSTVTKDFLFKLKKNHKRTANEMPVWRMEEQIPLLQKVGSTRWAKWQTFLLFPSSVFDLQKHNLHQIQSQTMRCNFI